MPGHSTNNHIAKRPCIPINVNPPAVYLANAIKNMVNAFAGVRRFAINIPTAVQGTVTARAQVLRELVGIGTSSLVRIRFARGKTRYR